MEKETTVKKLVLVRGIPGSGKTTYAKTLNCPNHFEADMWFDIFNNGEFDKTKLSSAHDWCQDMCEYAMSIEEPMVVVSNTFVKKAWMMIYKAMAKKYGYEVEIVVMRGNYKSVHNVPEDVMARIRSMWEE